MKERNTPLIYKTVIMILPIGVVIGTAVFMWMYYAKHKEKQDEQAVISAPGIRLNDLNDMAGKFTQLIGPRDIKTERGRSGMRRAAAMIEGRLGPQNVGYQVRKGAGEAAYGMLWKSLWVDVRGKTNPDQVVVAAVPYSGDGEDGDANAVSTLMMVASSLARSEPNKTIRVVFLPYDISPDLQNSWIKKYCVADDEQLARVIGLRSIPVPEANLPTDGWAVLAPENQESVWLDFINNQGGLPSTPQNAVWLTHFVFFNGNFQDDQRQRAAATLTVAEQLRNWILMMANE